MNADRRVRQPRRVTNFGALMMARFALLRRAETRHARARNGMNKRRPTLKRTAVGVVAVATFGLVASVAWATGTLDQRNPGPSTSTSEICLARLAQTFTAGLTGSLDTVKLALSQTNASGDDAVVSILGTDSVTNPGSPDDGDVLATQAVPHIDSSNLEDATIVFDNPASITAGTRYAIVLSAPTCQSSNPQPFYSWGMTINFGFTGGSACVDFGDGAWHCDAFTDPKIFVFATYVTTPAPPPSADVAVSIAGPTSAKKGAQVTYVITVSNTGPDTAHNVVLSDPVPAGATFLGVTTTAGSCTGPRVGRQGPIRCALGDLVSGGSALSSTAVKVAAKVGSTLANVVSAQSTADGTGSATPDPQGSNNTASLITHVTK